MRALVLFTVAMALHFVMNDYGLREHHKDAYMRLGAGSSPPPFSPVGSIAAG
jgi:hypothetical protein